MPMKLPVNKDKKSKIEPIGKGQHAARLVQLVDFGCQINDFEEDKPPERTLIFTYELPRTGIKVDVPKGKIQRVNGVDDNKGVIPDILIKDHLLDEEDEILDGLLKQLKNTH